MRRVFATTAAVTCGSNAASPCGACNSSVTAAAAAAAAAATTRVALLQQRCGLRNLHRYPQARYKSLVKDRHRFARNWWLTAGNNYELVSEVGHEREATENLATYHSDRDDALSVVLSTSELRDLPPAQRLDALVGLMQRRWRVRDGNRGLDKATLLLQALECFAELRARNEVGTFAQLPRADQGTFLQYVDGCCRFAQAAAHAHPDAVAVLVRAAQICDDMRCRDKRDEVLRLAETTTRRLDRAYAFARPTETHVALRPTSHDVTETAQTLRTEAALRAHVARTAPHALARVRREQAARQATPEFFVSTRRHKEYLTPLRARDMRLRVLLTGIARPEHDAWTSPSPPSS